MQAALSLEIESDHHSPRGLSRLGLKTVNTLPLKTINNLSRYLYLRENVFENKTIKDSLTPLPKSLSEIKILEVLLSPYNVDFNSIIVWVRNYYIVIYINHAS